MNEFLTAVGLLLAIEGVLYSVFPNAIKDLARRILSQPVERMRTIGVVSLAIGVFIIWIIRS